MTNEAGRRILGVIGGMGPAATVDFMDKVVRHTAASTDQDHIPMVVSSIPQIPDRVAALDGCGPSPLPMLVNCGRRLIAAGAAALVMPCNTAHLWFEDLRRELAVPMLHIVDAAMDELAAVAGPGARVGLLATSATIRSRLYETRAVSWGTDAPASWITPDAEELRTLVAPGIRDVKAGDLEEGRTSLRRAAHSLVERGATAIVLGCTEIPLVLEPTRFEVPLIDATAALARRVVEWSRAS